MKNILKKAVSILCAICLIVCTFSVAAAAETKTVKTNIPPKLLFLGDSIAAGYGLDGYDANDLYNCASYANILGKKYTAKLEGKTTHVMINKAVSGYTSSDLLKLIKSGNIDSDIKNTSAVVVSIGGNDLLSIFFDMLETLGYDKKTGSIDVDKINAMAALKAAVKVEKDAEAALEKFVTRLRKIINEIKKRTKAEIFVQTLYDPIAYYSKLKVITDLSGKEITHLNTIIKGNADRDGKHYYTVVDVAAEFEGKSGELTNMPKFDIHPNAKGHKIIAKLIDKAIRSGRYTYKKKV